MIDAGGLLVDVRRLVVRLVDDLRERTVSHEGSRVHVEGVFGQAVAAGRTEKSFEEWREDLLAQVAAGWVLGCVFVRFCEDNGLVEVPLLSGPGERLQLARDHRAAFFAEHAAADDRDWLVEVFGRYARLPGTSGVFGERNPLWQLSPGPDGAKELVELWWATDDEGRVLRHDFTDGSLNTRFLGDLYQDLSEHARKQFALLQTPDFVEAFILDRTLEPALETFGLAGTRMIDPTCGSGHFLLGAFDRLLERWRQVEPATDVRELAQRTLDAVNGVDINPFAVAIARFRLLVVALRASGIGRLSDAPDFRINVAAGDSLLHGTRPGALFSGATEFAGVLDHHYPTEDAEDAERILQADTYQAVVGNPPYITVADKALRDAYRSLYRHLSGKYALSVPFLVRFHELAVRGNGQQEPGYVGQITANSFMKRGFGKPVVEKFFPTIELTHVIDTSGAYIPGHGTPTVILFSRDKSPQQSAIRAVLGIRGEQRPPDDPSAGNVWTSIVALLDQACSENSFVSVADMPAKAFWRHPWSLQGGIAPELNASIDRACVSTLDVVADELGIVAISGFDDVFVLAPNQPRRLGLSENEIRPLVEGAVIRDWAAAPRSVALFPYSAESNNLIRVEEVGFEGRFLWPFRSIMEARATFSGGTYRSDGRPWWEWHQLSQHRLNSRLSLVFAAIATHNHFVFDRGGPVFKQSAPVIQLSECASEDEYLELLGLLNSSVACFWMKQVFHNKDASREHWENRYDVDSTKLKQFPLPSGRPLVWAERLDGLAGELGGVLPSAVAERVAPTRGVLDEAGVEVAVLRARMVGLQEELDWACYGLYGLVDEDLTFPVDEVPALAKGERAFEIALARRMAAGEVSTAWFERHGSTPITELPGHWPDGYRELVERRLALIGSDRSIGLLERPEYKRRWNWDELGDLEREAQRTWLLDRIEKLLADGEGEPAVTTVARLADRLWQDEDARAVAEDLEGVDADPVRVVGQLVASAGVAYAAALRLKPSGLVKRQVWERTWVLQRVEDALDARAALPADHADHLDADALAAAKKDAGVDRIPVPPKYASSDFRDPVAWRLRGKLDVPKERFILYPGTHAGADATMVVGWAGWDHLQQLRALAGLYTARKQDGAEVGELTPMLAGMTELLPWVVQWHDDPDPVYGDRMGQYFTGFLDTERAAHGLTPQELTDWRP